MAHRIVAGRPLTDLPLIADVMRDDHPYIAIQKSAQVGATEMLINLAFWAADTGYADRGNVLFLLPTQSQMEDFAASRFDRAIGESAYLASRVPPEPRRRRSADNRRLKYVGNGLIYMRGSESERQVASVDADMVIIDEFDDMDPDILPRAQKRLTSSRAGRLLVASTPRHPEVGVNGLYMDSDQRRYLIECGDCREEQPLTWAENVDIEQLAIVCRRCRAPLDTQRPGRWVAEAPGNNRIHGYHISRLYSPWVDLARMVEASLDSSVAAKQEFMNSDLGETFVVPGGKLTWDVLRRCRDEYRLEDYAGQPCIMGVDVGTSLNVVVRENPWRQVGKPHSITTERTAKPRLWFVGGLRQTSDHGPSASVVPASDRRRIARDLSPLWFRRDQAATTT